MNFIPAMGDVAGMEMKILGGNRDGGNRVYGAPR